MGATDFEYSSVSEVFNEIAASTPAYAGLTHDRLQSGGIQRPVESPTHAGTPVLFSDSDQKISVVELTYADLVPSADADAEPLTFAPGRVLSQPERDVVVLKPGEMNTIEREQQIQVHADDANAAGLSEGSTIQVRSGDGHVLARGRAVFESPQTGLVGVTTLFGELATKMYDLETPDWSPLMPGLGYARVTLESAPAEQEAGAAAD